MRRGRGIPGQLRTEPAGLVSTIQVEDGAGLLQTRLSSHTHPAGPGLERKSARDCGRRKAASQVQLPGYLEAGGKKRRCSDASSARRGEKACRPLGRGLGRPAFSRSVLSPVFNSCARTRVGGACGSRLSLQRKRDPGPQVEAGRIGREDALLSFPLAQ